MSQYLAFPGDPPVPDLLALIGPVFLLAGIAALLTRNAMKRRRPGSERSVRLLLAIELLLLVPGVASTAVGGIVVAQRHIGSWAPIRETLLHENHRIEVEIGSRRRLTESEYKAIAARLGSGPTFQLSADRFPIRLYLFYDYPWIGLDFGGGGVAQFELLSMVCIGSD